MATTITQPETAVSLQTARIEAENELRNLKAELKEIIQKLDAVPRTDAEERTLRRRRRTLEDELIPAMQGEVNKLLERAMAAGKREKLAADRAERERLVDDERRLTKDFEAARSLAEAKRQAAWHAHRAVAFFDERKRNEAAAEANLGSCILQAIPTAVAGRTA